MTDNPTEAMLPVTQEALEPCPFCGAKPLQGLTKVEHCQLHGEPFQRFEVKCPHGCARIDRPNRPRAIEAWNTRSTTDKASQSEREAVLEVALRKIAMEREECAKVADEHAKESWGLTEEENAAMAIAAAIRARATIAGEGEPER